jgi:hypothetical protein
MHATTAYVLHAALPIEVQEAVREGGYVQIMHLLQILNQSNGRWLPQEKMLLFPAQDPVKNYSTLSSYI